MKNLKMILTTLVFALFFQNVNAQFQTASYTSNTSLEENALYATVALELGGYEIADVYETSLEEGEEGTVSRMFLSGNEYVVLAVSEDGVRDLDISLVDTYGNVVTKDIDENDGGSAIVQTFSNSSKRLKINVKNYDSANGYSSYDMIIMVAYK